MNAIELYRELTRALGLDRAPNPDLELVGVAGMYVLSVVWLARLWFTRHNVRRRRQLARGRPSWTASSRCSVSSFSSLLVFSSPWPVRQAGRTAAGRRPVGLPTRPHFAGS